MNDLDRTRVLNRSTVLTTRLLTTPGAIADLRDAIAAEAKDGLRAASYDTDRSDGQPWCWSHQRATHECEQADLTCEGERLQTIDHIGDLATTPDPTTKDLAWLDAWLRRHATDIDKVAILYARYLPDRGQQTTDDIGCPADCCAACWTDEGQQTLLSAHARRGLCSWCSRYDRVWGHWPPPAVLRWRRTHAGRYLTTTTLARLDPRVSPQLAPSPA